MPALNGSLRLVLDFLAFTGLWPAAVAASLVAACALALGAAPSGHRLLTAMALAIGGTLVVYNVDRLRDLDHDRMTAPARSDFVDRHRRALTRVVGGSATLCLPLAALLPPTVWGVCAVALGLGLFHRRLKGKRAFLSVFYMTLAWVAVGVGIPWAASADPGSVTAPAGVTALTVGPAIAANLIGSQERGHSPTPQQRFRLRVGGAIALAGCLVPLVAGTVRPLIAIPLAAWLSLALFQNHERYGLLVLDGALLAGAGIAAAVIVAGP